MCLEWLIFAFAAPGGGGTGSATIGTTSISNNSATPGNGGGILVESLATTVATTSLTSNSAGNRGGGIFVRGASLLLNGTSPSITFTGNTATNGGSRVSTSSAVRVNGTNTTIGGDIEISVLVEQHHRPLTTRSLVPRHSTDSAGNSTTKTVEVHVGHNITSPKSGNRFKINTAVTFTGTFWDVPGKRHTAVWQFDDLTTGATVTEPVGSSNGTVKGTYTFKDPGVYKVTLKVTDNTGATGWVDTQDDVESIVVIYDPASGYTIGGGWISSPLGALISDPTMTGKMSFGFNSKFFKGATNPKGESQLDFLLGNFDFNALNYDYLMIDKARAQFRGSGKLNGVSGYDFIVTVIDGGLPGGGGVDKFRIKIWEKTTGIIVYDNQYGASDAADPITPIGLGGDISIKK